MLLALALDATKDDTTEPGTVNLDSPALPLVVKHGNQDVVAVRGLIHDTGSSCDVSGSHTHTHTHTHHKCPVM